jgi:hypothetical protein
MVGRDRVHIVTIALAGGGSFFFTLLAFWLSRVRGMQVTVVLESLASSNFVILIRCRPRLRFVE